MTSKCDPTPSRLVGKFARELYNRKPLGFSGGVWIPGEVFGKGIIFIESYSAVSPVTPIISRENRAAFEIVLPKRLDYLYNPKVFATEGSSECCNISLGVICDGSDGLYASMVHSSNSAMKIVIPKLQANYQESYKTLTGIDLHKASLPGYLTRLGTYFNMHQISHTLWGDSNQTPLGWEIREHQNPDPINQKLMTHERKLNRGELIIEDLSTSGFGSFHTAPKLSLLWGEAQYSHAAKDILF
jgi:hypothetical protein